VAGEAGDERGEDFSEVGLLGTFDWRRELTEERREEPGRTASMTLLKVNGMVFRGEEGESSRRAGDERAVRGMQAELLDAF
jgi:hypothetical protein